MKVRPGHPYPLGATWDGAGVNFAVFSENATRVELCLFDSPDAAGESARVPLIEQTDMIWHCFLRDVRPGQLYGYRVHGPYAPEQGHRFNPAKLVLDPYAKGVGRTVRWDDSLFGYTVGGDPFSCDGRDSAPFAPLATVVDTAFVWGADVPPRTPWHKTIIYETHVRGITQRHPAVPERLRGTYAGMASDAVIDHLLKLGVTAIELMPVHHHANDRHLVDRGLTNYWGYSTLSYFAPDIRYAAETTPHGCVREFKNMVRRLHEAGLEVILDVVYNHTAEGNHLGPTLSLRGIDNSAYYRLAGDRRYYMDFTGCGNTLNMVHARVLQLIMDSLRYWVQEMHIDGFRFDLASALARELYEVDKLGAFFDIIHQDPVLSQVKLIAEPWDLGDGGYQVGNFPIGWTEWNAKYRDAVRRFWRGDGGLVSELATRMAGSSDLYAHSGRRPYASINFVTAHDGFTLHDLVSFDQKHNEANGDHNSDGENDNLSWNCGAEGPTDSPSINSLREKQKRNFIATLMLSQGVPMLCGGDEIGRTQGGNNNAYCQDNEVSWYDWQLAPSQRDLLAFADHMIGLRKGNPVLCRRRFFLGRSIRGEGVKDIAWYSPDGREMDDQGWAAPSTRSLGILLSGNEIPEVDENGDIIVGETLFLMFNAAAGPVTFTLPSHRPGQRWERLVDTSTSDWARTHFPRDGRYRLRSRATAVFALRVPSRRLRKTERDVAESQPEVDRISHLP